MNWDVSERFLVKYVTYHKKTWWDCSAFKWAVTVRVLS